MRTPHLQHGQEIDQVGRPEFPLQIDDIGDAQDSSFEIVLEVQKYVLQVSPECAQVSHQSIYSSIKILIFLKEERHGTALEQMRAIEFLQEFAEQLELLLGGRAELRMQRVDLGASVGCARVRSNAVEVVAELEVERGRVREVCVVVELMLWTEGWRR